MPTDQTLDARRLVDSVLADALHRRASDVHIEPIAGGYEIRLRLDGLLQPIATHDSTTGRAMVTRLMVLAKLLTYRLDIPQEGKFTIAAGNAGQSELSAELDLRLAIMPTVHGLRAAIRLPADLAALHTLAELQLSPSALDGLLRFAASDAGMLVIVGPAGSGKTTTAYALLRQIAASGAGLSIVSLEDPVERALPGVTQIEVTPFGQLSYERALRSIMRQDPQVLMLGEIRDTATASLAVQAALSGHRLICTFHAADAAGAIARLLEMGIEPYHLASALSGIVSQRLLRRIGCEGGYRGRAPVTEFVAVDEALRSAILARQSSSGLRAAYQGQAGYLSLREAGQRLVQAKITDTAEVQRVLGTENLPLA